MENIIKSFIREDVFNDKRIKNSNSDYLKKIKNNYSHGICFIQNVYHIKNYCIKEN